jgi:hypothetical protein
MRIMKPAKLPAMNLQRQDYQAHKRHRRPTLTLPYVDKFTADQEQMRPRS